VRLAFGNLLMTTSAQPPDNELSGEQHAAAQSAAVCPACGARVKAGAARCWYCESDVSLLDPLALQLQVQASLVAAPPAPRPDEPLQFSLATLLVVMTFIAACLGISVAVPPLGIPISAIAVGGLVRTLAVGKHYRRLGLPFLLDDKIAEFTVSCGIVVGALGVLLITLLLTGFFGMISAAAIARFNVPYQILMLLTWSYGIIAVVAPLAVSGWFLWATRPR